MGKPTNSFHQHKTYREKGNGVEEGPRSKTESRSWAESSSGSELFLNQKIFPKHICLQSCLQAQQVFVTFALRRSPVGS